MLRRLFTKVFGRRRSRGATRPEAPVTSLRPAVPAATGPAMAPPPAPPPPPPPPVRAPAGPAPAAPAPAPPAPVPDTGGRSVAAPSAPEAPAREARPAASTQSDTTAERAKVQLVLEDGTTATPALDRETEDRLQYILDNIVPPSEDPPA